MTALSTSPDVAELTLSTLVLVGTTKGLFVLGSKGGREQFELAGPTFAGEEVYATCVDTRSAHNRACSSGSVSNHWGPVLRRSDDLGATWTEDERAALAFPAGTDASLARIWQLATGPADQPDVLYAGVEPAALFRSDDGGPHLHARARAVGPSPPAAVGARWRRALPPHGARPPERPGAAADRHLGRGRVPQRRRRRHVAGQQPGHRRRLPARRPRARVRPVRAQGGARRRRPRAALPPAPRRHLPQRRRRRLVAAR